jgi:hypothetical protein
VKVDIFPLLPSACLAINILLPLHLCPGIPQANGAVENEVIFILQMNVIDFNISSDNIYT